MKSHKWGNMPTYFWFVLFDLYQNKISTLRGEHQQFALASIWREILDHDAAFSWLTSTDNLENCNHVDRYLNATQRTKTGEDSCCRERERRPCFWFWLTMFNLWVMRIYIKNKQTSVHSGKSTKMTPQFSSRRRVSERAAVWGGVRLVRRAAVVCGPRQCYWHLDSFAKLEKYHLFFQRWCQNARARRPFFKFILKSRLSVCQRKQAPVSRLA